MSKELNLTRREAQKKLILFLKLRKGKPISEKTILDFEKLTARLYYDNFKSSNTLEINRIDYEKHRGAEEAIKSIKSGFIQWENSGFSKITDITNFGHYTDNTHKAKINGEFKEITLRDYYALKYIFFGES